MNAPARLPLQWGLAIVPGTLLVIAFTFTLVFSPLITYAKTSVAGSAYIRVNQIGYITGETKQAILMATSSARGTTFSVINKSTGKSLMGRDKSGPYS